MTAEPVQNPKAILLAAGVFFALLTALAVFISPDKPDFPGTSPADPGEAQIDIEAPLAPKPEVKKPVSPRKTDSVPRRKQNEVIYQDPARYLNIKRLDTYISGDADSRKRPLVVAVGSSLTQSAFYPDEQMTEVILQNNGPEISFIRITHLNRRLDAFLPYLDNIAEARPDAVLLQTSIILFYTQKEKPTFYPANDAANPNYRKREPKRSRPSGRHQTEEQELKALKRLYSASKPYTGKIPELISFLDKCAAYRIPVYFLDITGHPKAIEAIPAEIRSVHDQIMKWYSSGEYVRYLEFPKTLDEEHYNFLTHLTSEGRIKFCEWFSKQLPAILDQTAGTDTYPK